MKLDERVTNKLSDETPTGVVAGLQRMGTEAKLGLAGLAIFVLITILVQWGLLRALDYSVATSMQYVENPVLDLWMTVAGDLAVAELSVVYASVLSFALWRAGASRWSLAPFAFLLPTVIELAFKTWIYQPSIPLSLHFHVSGGNVFPSVLLEGSFPSGHSLRSAFFCTFLAILMWQQRGPFPKLLALVVLLIAPAIGLAMLYAAWHWTSDVVAGLILGASFALLVAPPVATRLDAQRSSFRRSRAGYMGHGARK